MSHVSHVIVANHIPFRIVLRDENDVWGPTLEQINRIDYDYVKLHRMSGYVDVGIRPYCMGVCFDGTMVLPNMPSFREPDSARSLFNRGLAELLFGGVYCEAVSPDDIGYGILSGNGYLRTSGMGRGPVAAFHMAARTKYIGILDVIRLQNPESILVREYQDSIYRGRELLKELGKVPKEQILYACTYYVRKQWAEALIHLWTTVESVVEQVWQSNIVCVEVKPRRNRRDFLNDHRTWSVSTKLEVLYQKGLVKFETCEKLDLARRARNEFVHKGIQPSEDKAKIALESCFELASLCASGFSRTDLFGAVVHTVVGRREPEMMGAKRVFKNEDIGAWLPLPPIPGSKDWGDREFDPLDKNCFDVAETTPATNSGNPPKTDGLVWPLHEVEDGFPF